METMIVLGTVKSEALKDVRRLHKNGLSDGYIKQFLWDKYRNKLDFDVRSRLLRWGTRGNTAPDYVRREARVKSEIRDGYSVCTVNGDIYGNKWHAISCGNASSNANALAYVTRQEIYDIALMYMGLDDNELIDAAIDNSDNPLICEAIYSLGIDQHEIDTRVYLTIK